MTPPPPLSKAPSLIQGSGEVSGKSPPCIVCKRDIPHLLSLSGIPRHSASSPVKKRAKTTATTTFIPAPAPTFAILPTLLTEAAPIA
ncbi:hypothetical protein ACFX2G_019253 [Malus domestica]